jgi:putative two-component system hydrogenase maturation factor HypX/HoxX
MDRPLASYRARELAHMADNFFGPDPSYHLARRRFVRKESAETGDAFPRVLPRVA